MIHILTIVTFITLNWKMILSTVYSCYVNKDFNLSKL